MDSVFEPPLYYFKVFNNFVQRGSAIPIMVQMPDHLTFGHTIPLNPRHVHYSDSTAFGFCQLFLRDNFVISCPLLIVHVLKSKSILNPQLETPRLYRQSSVKTL